MLHLRKSLLRLYMLFSEKMLTFAATTKPFCYEENAHLSPYGVPAARGGLGTTAGRLRRLPGAEHPVGNLASVERRQLCRRRQGLPHLRHLSAPTAAGTLSRGHPHLRQRLVQQQRQGCRRPGHHRQRPAARRLCRGVPQPPLQHGCQVACPAARHQGRRALRAWRGRALPLRPEVRSHQRLLVGSPSGLHHRHHQRHAPEHSGLRQHRP